MFKTVRHLSANEIRLYEAIRLLQGDPEAIRLLQRDPEAIRLLRDNPDLIRLLQGNAAVHLTSKSSIPPGESGLREGAAPAEPLPPARPDPPPPSAGASSPRKEHHPRGTQ